MNRQYEGVVGTRCFKRKRYGLHSDRGGGLLNDLRVNRNREVVAVREREGVVRLVKGKGCWVWRVPPVSLVILAAPRKMIAPCYPRARGGGQKGAACRNEATFALGNRECLPDGDL